MLTSIIEVEPQQLAGFITSSNIPRLLLALFGLCIVKSIYNVYLHPLSSFNGPVWACISPFYLTYLFATKRSHLRTKELHDQYGSIVRIGPNLLSFSDPTWLPTVYHRTVDKTPFYSTGLAGEVAPLLQIQPHHAHTAKLKVLASTYSMKNLKLQEPVVDERIAMVIETLRERHVRPNTTANISDWVRWYVYDTITQIIYGEPAGFVSQGRDVDGLIQSWHDMFFLGGLVATIPWLVHPLITSWPLKRWLMPNKGLNYGAGSIMKAHARFNARRRAHPELARPGNIFDSFSKAKDEEGRPFTPEDVERECYLLTVASQDTTSAFVSGFIGLVSSHPRVHASLMAEIAEFERTERISRSVVQFDELAKMPYFQACVKETLRLRSPTPIILPRYAPKDGLWLGEHYVPGGTELGANPWIIHRNESIFGADVDSFWPERWLGSSDATRKMTKYEFMWGYGSRRCIGKNIALLDGCKFVLQLFRELSVKPTDCSKPWYSENQGIILYFQQPVTLAERGTT